MAGHGGGAWKVAYADFVTAMMAFFLVMWIVAQNKPVKEAVAMYFRDPSGTLKIPGGKSNSPNPLNNGGPSPLDKSPFNSPKGRPMKTSGLDSDDSEEARTSARINRIAIGNDENSTVGTQVVFGDDTATLGDAGRQTLNSMLPALQGKFSKIEVRGHASGRLPKGTAFKNAWDLSYARSVAVMQYLVEKGIDARRFRLSQGGSNDPNMQIDVSEGLGSNSRVELIVLNEVIAPPSDAAERRNERAKKRGPKVPVRPPAATEPAAKKSSGDSTAH